MTEAETLEALKTAKGYRKSDLWRHLKRLRRQARKEDHDASN
jgi:hypothetical protein